jgi:hypothetical protein
MTGKFPFRDFALADSLKVTEVSAAVMYSLCQSSKDRFSSPKARQQDP